MGRLRHTIKSMAQGEEITPGGGHMVAALLETYRKSLETTELLERIVALEKKVSKQFLASGRDQGHVQEP